MAFYHISFKKIDSKVRLSICILKGLILFLFQLMDIIIKALEEEVSAKLYC
jgi:hypothetical protein